ncbi:MAG: hypothetical protein AAF291_04170 [Pseudomonadota bacterium]
MPYKPNQIDEEERSKLYNLMWVASAASALNLANAFLGADNIIVGLAWGFTMTGLFLAAFGSYADEFMRGRLEIAMRFAMGFLVLFLFANWIVNVADIAHSAGYALASEETQTGASQFIVFWTDAQTLTAFTAFVFYAGYGFAVVRERWDGLPFFTGEAS